MSQEIEDTCVLPVCYIDGSVTWEKASFENWCRLEDEGCQLHGKVSKQYNVKYITLGVQSISVPELYQMLKTLGIFEDLMQQHALEILETLTKT